MHADADKSFAGPESCRPAPKKYRTPLVRPVGAERRFRRAGCPFAPIVINWLSMAQLENAMGIGEPMRKDEAHELVNRMPEDATWDDLIDEIYVRQVIEQGLSDSKAGKTTDVREVRRRYGLTE